MRDQVPPGDTLAVAVRVELAGALGALVDPRRPVRGGLQRDIAQGVAGVMTMLGLPGQPAVVVVALDEAMPAGRFLRVLVNGVQCRYSDDLLQAIHSYTTGRLMATDATPTTLLAWLTSLLDGHSEQAAEFLALTCVEIVKQRPRALFGPAQAQAYTAWLSTDPAAGGPHEAAWSAGTTALLPILHDVLDLRISLADRTTVGRLLREGFEAGRSPRAISESLIEALCPRVVELRMPSPDLRQFTIEWQEDGAAKFQYLRDGLFEELGVTYPVFRFAADDALKPNSFRFQINHLATPPLVSLAPTQCFVNEDVRRLPAGLSGDPAANPVTRYPQAVIDRKDQQSAADARLTTWDQPDYLVLCLADALRVHGGCFIDRRFVQHMVQMIASAYPSLGEIAQRRISLEEMTDWLRQLVDEQISVRNLRLILETIADFDPAVTADPLIYLRQALQREIAAKHARGTSTVIAYLLGKDLETLIPQATEPAAAASPQEVDQVATTIIGAIKKELADLRAKAPTAAIPSLLTFAELRRPLRELIAPELPRVNVISFPEIPPLMNVQPVDRISLAKDPS